MLWLQKPNQSSVDNSNHVRLEASRLLRYKQKEYLKGKIEKLETNIQINIRELYRGISDLKKGY